MKTNMITFNNDFTKAYVSSSFMKKAHVYGTREYKMLSEFRAENPTIEIAVRKASAAPNYNLTYTNMEAYIKTKPNAEALLAEFERIKGEAVVQRNRHLYVVNWFKTMFPNYAEAELFQKEEKKTADVIVLPAAAANNEEEMAS